MRKYLSSLCVIVMTLFLVCGCSFNKPEKTVVLNLAAQNCGFLLVQENLPLALEVHQYSKHFVEVRIGDFDELTFHRWTEGIIGKLKLDPFLEMNFKEMVKLVNIEIELSGDGKETAKLIRGAIENFIVGIEAGR